MNHKKMLQKFLLICGILSALLYIGTDILATIHWEGYSPASQTVSELIAINAPTRSLVVPLFVVYALLVFAFGFGIWRSAGQKRSLRFVGSLMAAKEILGLVVTLVFPIHLRGVEGTLSDVMHGILTGVGVLLCMFPAMVFGAIAFGKQFRIYSILLLQCCFSSYVAFWLAYTNPSTRQTCLHRGWEFLSASTSLVTCYGLWYWLLSSCVKKMSQVQKARAK